MAHYAGTQLYVRFEALGGTATLTGDQRTFDVSRGAVLADSTAGSDAATKETEIREDNSFTWNGLADSDSSGTTLWQTYLACGVEGTLIWGPNGTASGYKGTCEVIVRSSGASHPYDGMTEWNAEFGGQTVISDTTW